VAQLIANNLAKAYRGREVVQDVSLHLDSGQVVGLLGPNGAGKTTCFYMIIGIIPADRGTITINGEDITARTMHERRIEIARALATEPDFILLDEPFAGVDPISVNDIKQIINHLRDRGIGVLITDHNVRDTLDICEKAYIVGEGHIIAAGSAEDVLSNERVRKIYLGDQFHM
jgi:ABC-type lipopolysaccharide export system ATPase subunit